METEKSEQTQRETEAQKNENAKAISIRGSRHFGGDPHLARQFAQWDGEAELWNYPQLSTNENTTSRIDTSTCDISTER